MYYHRLSRHFLAASLFCSQKNRKSQKISTHAICMQFPSSNNGHHHSIALSLVLHCCRDYERCNHVAYYPNTAPNCIPHVRWWHRCYYFVLIIMVASIATVATSSAAALSRAAAITSTSIVAMMILPLSFTMEMLLTFSGVIVVNYATVSRTRSWADQRTITYCSFVGKRVNIFIRWALTIWEVNRWGTWVNICSVSEIVRDAKRWRGWCHRGCQLVQFCVQIACIEDFCGFWSSPTTGPRIFQPRPPMLWGVQRELQCWETRQLLTRGEDGSPVPSCMTRMTLRHIYGVYFLWFSAQ